MLRTFRWNHDLQFSLTSIPRGSYQVYVWTCEPNAPLNAALSIEENVVLPNYNTGPAGHWDRLGPFPVTVDDGNLQVRFLCAAPTAASFLSGIEVWQAVPLPPQAGTFYRGINVGGPATVIDGHNWQADGAPNFTFNADPFPFSLKDAQSNNVPAAVTYDVVSKTAQLQPLSPLNTTATYTATLKGGPGGLTDFAGNNLPSNVSWSFTTGQAPQAATPTFSPVGGTYSTAQSVSISTTSAGTKFTTPPMGVRRLLLRRFTPDLSLSRPPPLLRQSLPVRVGLPAQSQVLPTLSKALPYPISLQQLSAEIGAQRQHGSAV